MPNESRGIRMVAIENNDFSHDLIAFKNCIYKSLISMIKDDDVGALESLK